jgi:hypothetical protein
VSIPGFKFFGFEAKDGSIALTRPTPKRKKGRWAGYHNQPTHGLPRHFESAVVEAPSPDVAEIVYKKRVARYETTTKKAVVAAVPDNDPRPVLATAEGLLGD